MIKLLDNRVIFFSNIKFPAIEPEIFSLILDKFKLALKFTLSCDLNGYLSEILIISLLLNKLSIILYFVDNENFKSFNPKSFLYS